MEDARRAEFIAALDAADFELSEWEAEFTGSMFQRTELHLGFTDKMRVQIDRLMNKYGRRVKWSGAPSGGAMASPLKPVRSETRVAYVPDEATKLFNRR